MIVLITGASHTGKTALSQKLLEKYRFPYLSIDHIKMGLIRSGNTSLTPLSTDEDLTAYLWPIVREIIKTAIENKQNLIIEGCYVPLHWADDFSKKYLTAIRCYCLIFTESYILKHFDDIRKHANIIEQRLDDADCTLESILADNAHYLSFTSQKHTQYIYIDDQYKISIEL